MGLLKNGCLMTLGLEVKLRELAEELAQKGETNQSQLARSLRQVMDKLETVEHDVKQRERQAIEKMCSKLNLPTKADIERLNKKLDDLASTMVSAQPRERSPSR